ncbi:unnamed protein product [Anisakis simplex]|uniref:Uncharacterized protein n=1 Tax=Anisakis simplex TaxID=6269 RepID=A0A0M3KE17_ANISI|nr:unnamed protein product [Anisakis simplex]
MMNILRTENLVFKTAVFLRLYRGGTVPYQVSEASPIFFAQMDPDDYFKTHRELQRDTMTYDVYVNIRRVLPTIRAALKKIGKLDEFIEDFNKCSNFD